MARGSADVSSRDGGLGYTGPAGAANWAAVGVASGAQAIGTQMPVRVSSAADVNTLFGRGPLRDGLVIPLTDTGADVLVMPLQRSSGGGAIGGATAKVSGTLSVTPSATGYSFGQEHVVLEVTQPGATAVAMGRLVVDNVPGPEFALTIGSATVLTRAQLGALATGVPDADLLSITVAFNGGVTAFVAGDRVEWRMSEPKASAGDMMTAVQKLADSEGEFEWIEVCGVTSPATQASLHTLAKTLPRATADYIHIHVQAPGPDLRTGATADALTPVWVSEATLMTDPPRIMNPRMTIWRAWSILDDPLTRQERVVPGMYDAIGALSARQAWEPVDALRHGPLFHTREIYPRDLTGAHIDQLDNAYYATFQRHTGQPGIYVTHGRLWTVRPQAGLVGSDYTGIERRRLIDLACRRVRQAILPRLNDFIRTDTTGHIAPQERDNMVARGLSALRTLTAQGVASAPEVVVTDSAEGLLVDDTIFVRIRFIPPGKAARLEASLEFYRGAPTDVSSMVEEGCSVMPAINGRTYEFAALKMTAGEVIETLESADYKASRGIVMNKSMSGAPLHWALGEYEDNMVTMTFAKADMTSFLSGVTPTQDNSILGGSFDATFTYSDTDQPETTDTVYCLLQGIEDRPSRRDGTVMTTVTAVQRAPMLYNGEQLMPAAGDSAGSGGGPGRGGGTPPRGGR